MKRILNTVLFAWLLLLASVYALDYQWTSFSKSNKPVMMPATAFCSGSTASGSYASGGDCYFKIGESGANYSLVPLYDANGNAYSTGWWPGGWLQRTDVTTWIAEPGSNILIPSEKATVDYIYNLAQNIGDAIISWYLYITGWNNYIRLGSSWDRISLQHLTGGTWVEENEYDPLFTAWEAANYGANGTIAINNGSGNYTWSDRVVPTGATWFFYDPIRWNLFVWLNSSPWNSANSTNTVILWGQNNNANQTTTRNNSAVIAGMNNKMWGIASAIVWGSGNIIWVHPSYWSSHYNDFIWWWTTNVINAWYNSAIIWWTLNTLWQSSNPYFSKESVIIWGNTNYLQWLNAIVLWWNNNTIFLDPNTVWWAFISTSYNTIWATANSRTLTNAIVIWWYWHTFWTPIVNPVIIWWSWNTISANANNSYAFGQKLTVAYADTFAFNNNWTYSTPTSWVFLVNAYGGMRVNWWIYDLSGNTYLLMLTWRTYLPSTWTITWPGTGAEVPTSKAVVDYIDLSAQNLWDIITTGWYYWSPVSWQTTTWMWRSTYTWDTVSTELYTGWIWKVFSYLTDLRGTIFTQPIKLEWSWLVRDDIQNLQMRDTDVTNDKPSLTAISGSVIKTRCFGNSDMMYGNVEIPHDMYNGTGSIISPHVHWMGSTTSATTTGIWYLDYTIRKLNTTYTATYTLTGAIYWINARQWMITELDDLPATWLSLWDTISFRIWRDSGLAADTYAGNMCLSQVGFHYQRDSMGSRQEYIK